MTDRPAAGEPAPAIELDDHEGRPWRLADHRGRVVLAVFHRHLR